MKHRILVIDDEVQILKALDRFLTHRGYQVTSSSHFEEALLAFEKNLFDAAVIDLKLADKNGIDFLTRVKKIQPDAVCILMTGYGTIDSAVEAMKKGAFHYLRKPFRLEDLKNLLNRAFENRQIRQKNLILKQQIRSSAGFVCFRKL